jgi:Stress responsive A/B Barrel Domain
MIVVQDKIEVPGNQLARLQRLFRDRYIDDAAQRGLHFAEFMVSPPLLLTEAPCTLWARWQVADAGAWWAMRAQSGSPSVTAFWKVVDEFCVSRERRYLTTDSPATFATPVDVSAFSAPTRGYRETAQLALRDSVTPEQRTELESLLRTEAAALPGLAMSSLGANLAPEYAAGHFTWDLLYPDSTTAEAARQSAAWRERILPALDRYCLARHALRLDSVAAGLRRPGIASAIKRTAYFRLLPGATAAQASAFEQVLLAMPAQIPQIQNWRLSRAGTLPWDNARCAPWSYVWEQEFAALDDLLGPYMIHPHHWAHVDRWFDPESGVQAVDVQLSHAFCAIEASVLSGDAA